MQGFPISQPSNVPLARVKTKLMPVPAVQKSMVMQPVNLRPLGNTVAMTVPSDNPFTGGQRFVVVTQASGGMARADATQRTAARFLPINGLGELSMEDEAYAAFNKMDPDAAKMDRAAYDASAKRTYWEGQVAGWRQQREAEASKQTAAAWSKAGDIFSTTIQAGSAITSDFNKTKQLALQAQIAEANKRQAEINQQANQAFWGRATDVSQYGAGMAARKGITIPLLIIGGGALAVALFLFMKKRRAASAPAAA